MKDDDTRRLLNVKLTTDENIRAAYIELLYPTIYKFSCLLNLRFFPFDIQESVCSMIFSSWTFDQTGIDYFAHSDIVGTTNYIENEGWHILKTSVKKEETKTSTASGMREEKVSLGITTLLSMSILMLMVSDQMPTTSTFIPLIGWFILAMITIITFGTLASSVIIAIQKRGRQKSRLTPRTICLVKFIAYITLEDIPKHLIEAHKKELKTTALQTEKRQDILKTKEPEGRRNRQWTLLQKGQRTRIVESHLCKLSTLSYNNTDLIPQKPDEGIDISDIPDTASAILIPSISSPNEGGNVAPKMNGNDGDSIRTTLEKPNSDSARQQRQPQNVSSLCDEVSIRQNRRLARDEYDWMAKVLERLFFILFIIIFVFVTVGINSLEVEKGDEMHYFISARQQLPHIRLVRDLLSTESMVMNREGSERYMNVIVKSRHWNGEHGAEISFLYPALYTIRCHIDIRYFPYDHQNCTLILGSWTSSKALLNYTADKIVNMNSYIPNEEWDILSFNLHRHEYVYECCQDPWVIIEGSLIIRRKPLYYIVNLIIPTTVLTLVAIVGFFTPASTSDERMEKITIGITALLAVSVLMLMVSDQMPTTSDFVPLIAWFYLSNIIVISAATFCTCTVLRIHGSHRNGKLPPILVRILFFKYICNYLCVSPPHELMMLWKRSRSTLTELSVKPSVQKMLERDNGIETKQTVSRLSAKENWARISVTLEDISSRNKDQSEVVRKESSLTSLIQKIRKTSAERKHLSLWNTAVQFIRFTSNDLPRKIESNELKSLKHRRQCTLEWEFLATVMDRVFLLFFSIITILIVTALAATAKLAQYHFDAALEIAHN
ncbi:unnamed protein product [Acanthocheilonema viteae]|uniref:Neurotransmitter-gated ion-channel ligand-binding domain-containing protein n=1 Tax=Acanthocheilonema viteae TaxID=6277 RepID=A0A498S1C6_ACAVI|nr:unnamed protein product [Acanthocheilonema viteae]